MLELDMIKCQGGSGSSRDYKFHSVYVIGSSAGQVWGFFLGENIISKKIMNINPATYRICSSPREHCSQACDMDRE
jgi:hypothetical protein